MRPFRLKGISTIDISREETEVGQEYTWLQHPGRGDEEAVGIVSCRRVAGAEGGIQRNREGGLSFIVGFVWEKERANAGVRSDLGK